MEWPLRLHSLHKWRSIQSSGSPLCEDLYGERPRGEAALGGRAGGSTQDGVALVGRAGSTQNECASAMRTARSH
uniref:Uncharacterized protein n=1 Tax=Arundo donax TaxID=35708 RepID=A0A0A9GKV9_ARUDO